VVHVEGNQLVFKPVNKQMKIISTQLWVFLSSYHLKLNISYLSTSRNRETYR
jgi:hypothetical protein